MVLVQHLICDIHKYSNRPSTDRLAGRQASRQAGRQTASQQARQTHRPTGTGTDLMVGSAASSNRAQEMACDVVSNPAARKMPALAARVCTGMGPPSLWLTNRLRQAHREVLFSGCTPCFWMMSASSSSFCSKKVSPSCLMPYTALTYFSGCFLHGLRLFVPCWSRTVSQQLA